MGKLEPLLLRLRREHHPQRSGRASQYRYIHSRGLKAGIYTDIGPKTCYPKPCYEGIYGHEEQDIRTFASWGIDLVEVDY
ncbi:MAG: hypothetical protein ACRD4O_17305, partial [Bryobacteraceae bacterium]